jgi:hypothetical protein
LLTRIKNIEIVEKQFFYRKSMFLGAWMYGWMDEWMDVKAVLEIACSN